MGEFLRSIFGMVRGGIHPREAGLAVLLGVLAGFVAGWNLTLAVLLLLVLVLRVPIKVFVQTFGLAILLAWAMTPASYHLGRFVLEHSAVGRWLAPQADRLWIVLFDWDRYTLIGGLVWGLVLGAPAAWLVAHLTGRLQQWHRALVAAASTSSHAMRPALRLAYWAIFGGLPQAAPPSQPARFLRPGGLAAIALLLFPCGLWCYAYGPTWTAQRFLDLLSLANQAEVTADHIELSFRDGLLSVRNLQVPDAACLDRDRVRIGTLTAQIKPARLLRGELHVQRLLVEDVRCDVPRDLPARPYRLHLPRLELGDGFAPPEAAPQPRPGIEEIPLQEWFAHWERYRRHLEQARDVLERLDEWCGRTAVDRQAPAASARAAAPAADSALRTARCDFGHRRPRVVVEAVCVRRLDPSWGLGAEATLELTDLTSNPQRLGRPTHVRFAAPEHHVRVELQLNYHEPQEPHFLAFDAPRIPLAALCASANEAMLAQRLPALRGASGRVHLQGRGHLDSRHVDVALRLEVRDLQLRGPATGEMAGLAPELWNAALARLDAWEVPARLHGSWTSPHVQWETQQVVASLRDRLWQAGYNELAMQVQQQFADAQHRAQQMAQQHVAAATQLLDQGRAQVDAALQRVEPWMHSAPHTPQALASAVQQQTDAARQAVESHVAAATQQVQPAWQQGVSIAEQWLHHEPARLGSAVTGPAAAARPSSGDPAALPRPDRPDAIAAGTSPSLGTSHADSMAALASQAALPGQRLDDARPDTTHDASASASNRAHSVGPSASDAIRNYVQDRLGRSNRPAALPDVERAAAANATASLPPPPADQRAAGLQQQIQSAGPFPQAAAAASGVGSLQYPQIEPIYLPEGNATRAAVEDSLVGDRYRRVDTEAPRTGLTPARTEHGSAARTDPVASAAQPDALPVGRAPDTASVASAPASDSPPHWPTAPDQDVVDDPLQLLGPRYGASRSASAGQRWGASSAQAPAATVPLDPRDAYTVPDDDGWQHATAIVTDVWPPEAVGMAHRPSPGGGSRADDTSHSAALPAEETTAASRPGQGIAGAPAGLAHGHVPGMQVSGALPPWGAGSTMPGARHANALTDAEWDVPLAEGLPGGAPTAADAPGMSLYGGGWSTGQQAAPSTPTNDATAPADEAPLWKRAATSVTSGVKRLWPFGKKDAADETPDPHAATDSSQGVRTEHRVAQQPAARPTSGYETPPPGASSSPSTMPSWLPKLW